MPSLDDSMDVGVTPCDFFEHEPSKVEKDEWKRATKAPSEWLRLLCKDWVIENESLVEHTDARLIEYKPYTQGVLSSQLLVRLSVPGKDDHITHAPVIDFWGTLGIMDEFDKSYIVAQIEKFDAIYDIRTRTEEEQDHHHSHSTFDFNDPTALAAAAAGLQNQHQIYSYDAATVAAVQKQSDLSSAHRTVREPDLRMEGEKEYRSNQKEIKAKEREAHALKKAHERAAREASREEKRRKKLEIRQQREKFAQEQKDAAIRRAAEIVRSNRVPIEITRGAAAAKAVTNAMTQSISSGNASIGSDDSPPMSKKRSAVVVSTAKDLHQIVTHSRNLWHKYNAIAKEHNQRVNWSTVSKELGIHVKVREKYARMHSRAEARGFDWVKDGHLRIRDHPEIFMEPTAEEQRAKIPPPAHIQNQTVLVRNNKEVVDEAVEAAARVVDNMVTSPPVEAHVETNDEITANAAAVAATLVADPIAGHRELVHEESV